MPTSTNELKPIPENPPRWKPSTDPASINVTGLDTTASVNDQIDQIDQLITLKLQDIDANFSRMQQVLSNRILPAFKRYSIGTEPVREAAKFWTSFYEQAAQVRIPTSDDFSSLQEASSGAAVEEPNASSRTEDSLITSGSSANTFDPNRTPSESSFIPAHAAVSSTPAAMAARTVRENYSSFTTRPPTTDPSWGMSIESPLIRLDRELRDFARADPQPASTSASVDLLSEADLTVGNVTTVAADETVHAPAPAPGPSNTRKSRPTVQTQVVLPHSSRPNSATPARNPYLPAHTDPRDWSGIIDLRSPQPVPSFSAAADKEDDLTLPTGMSPPVMVPFATLPSLGRSPAKNAAANIRRALVRNALRAGSGDSSVSTGGSGSLVPTPPSLARYTRDTSMGNGSNASLGPDLELESMMRRVELPPNPQQQHWWQSPAASTSAASSTSIPDRTLSTPSYYTTTTALAPAPAPAAYALAHEAVPVPPEPSETLLPPHSGVVAPLIASVVADATIDARPPEADAEHDDNDASSSSTFSSSGEDSVHNTAHPSAAFLLASRQRGRHDDHDDDFDDDDELDNGDDDFDDSLDAEDAARAPVHPFARALLSAAPDDSSFDSFSFDDNGSLSGDGYEGGGGEAERPEETLFGVRPAERDRAAQPHPRLRMFGDELLQDTIGIGTQLARAGRIEESPTPWGGGAGGHGG
ncbi:hypothetical protein BJV74DRAFT_590288 [Russula compacta]|nr:hypothetical protein BJV74DRAFT_590288 [Russula compacta]